MNLTHGMQTAVAAALTASIAGGSGCGGAGPAPATSAEEAQAFLAHVDETLKRLGIQQSQAGWVAQTYITPDTEAMDARATREAIEAVAQFAKEATRFDRVEVSADERRQLNLLKLSLEMAAPSVPAEAEELTAIVTRMRSVVRHGEVLSGPGSSRSVPEHR